MKILDEELKKRALSKTELEQAGEFKNKYIEEHGEKEFAKHFPIFSVTLKNRNFGYKLFITLACKLLNDNEDFKDMGYHAEVIDKDFGDGTNMSILITNKGNIITAVSSIEDYLKSNCDNGSVYIDRFVENLITFFRR